jgi:hypothetical protein
MKQQLLLTLVSSLVLSSSGDHNYSIFCNVAAERKVEDCHVEVPHTNLTLNHLVLDALHSCVREVTNEVVDWEVYEVDEQGDQNDDQRRLLDDIAVTRERLLLEECDSDCCCQPACQTFGFCAGMSCGTNTGTMSCNRRLIEEKASDRATRGLAISSWLDLPELSLKCTKSVRALATLFGWSNRCFGTDPSSISCAVSEDGDSVLL